MIYPSVRRLIWQCATRLGYKNRTVYRMQQGNFELGPNVCLFSHFDPTNTLSSSVQHYLKHLTDCGFSIVLVTTSECPTDDFWKTASELTSWAIWRENQGLDFCSWKSALQQLPQIRASRTLLLANDSVYGPLFSLKPYFARADQEGNKLWGFTDNREWDLHLQSYFLYVPEQLCRSGFVQRFLWRVKSLAEKDSVIQSYEVGLSTKANRAGIRTEAFFPFQKTLAVALTMNEDFEYHERLKQGHVHNTTLFAWSLLIKKFQFPFLKREVLTKNRFASRHLPTWDATVMNCEFDLSKSIQEHLRNSYADASALAFGR